MQKSRAKNGGELCQSELSTAGISEINKLNTNLCELLFLKEIQICELAKLLSK